MNSEATTTTYVAYMHPGTFFSEESIKPVDERNPQQQASDAPDSAFAFFYFDVVTTIVIVGGERIETSSGRHNILLSNMRDNGWDPIVRCRTGNFQPFETGKHELIKTG